MTIFRRPYVLFATIVTVVYGAAMALGWEWTNAGAGGPRGAQGLSAYRGGK